MTLQSLKETIEKLDREATPGPWGIERTSDTNWIGPMRRSGDGKIAALVVQTDRKGLKKEYRDQNDADADFIAFARTALPQLLRIAEELEASLETKDLRIAGLEAALQRIQQDNRSIEHAYSELERSNDQHERKDQYMLELERRLKVAETWLNDELVRMKLLNELGGPKEASVRAALAEIRK